MAAAAAGSSPPASPRAEDITGRDGDEPIEPAPATTAVMPTATEEQAPRKKRKEGKRAREKRDAANTKKARGKKAKHDTGCVACARPGSKRAHTCGKQRTPKRDQPEQIEQTVLETVRVLRELATGDPDAFGALFLPPAGGKKRKRRGGGAGEGKRQGKRDKTVAE